MLEKERFEKALEGGPQSVDFTTFIVWLTTELNLYSKLQEQLQATTGEDDAEMFLMELSGFLREYGCPYSRLCDGPLHERLITKDDRLQIIDYFITELQAARISSHNQQQIHLKLNTKINSKASCLEELMTCLGVPLPSNDVNTTVDIFTSLHNSMQNLLAKIPCEHLGKSLMSSQLTKDAWKEVEKISETLKQDYNCRKEMVIKRLDLTVQSFKWSDKLQRNANEMSEVYRPLRNQMLSMSETSLAHLLAARDDLLRIEKTSSGPARERTKCGINRVLIGAVPDRGGRPFEMEPPLPEMPSFQKRQQGPNHQRGGGRGASNWSPSGYDRKRHGDDRDYYQSPKQRR